METTEQEQKARPPAALTPTLTKSRVRVRCTYMAVLADHHHLAHSAMSSGVVRGAVRCVVLCWCGAVR